MKKTLTTILNRRSFRYLFSVLSFLFIHTVSFAQPANDNPCNAIALTANTACSFATYTNAGATASTGVPAPGCASYAGGDVWFKVTVPAGGSLTIDSNTGVVTDAGMALYTGTCGALTLLSCDDDSSPNGLMPMLSPTGLAAGSTLFIRMWEYGNDNNGTFQICVTQPAPAGAGDNCSMASPFCTGTVYTFPNNTAQASIGAINCLLSTPNPVWYFMQIQNPGNLTVHIAQTNGSGTGIDVDFNLWGPFTSQAAGCAAIAAGTAPNVDCSYSIAAQEDADITGAVAGQFYILLLTNYSNQAGTITFSQTAGAATTNCNVLCNMTALTAVPGACTPATNTYSVTGQITFQYPPTSGTLTVSSSCGGSVTIPTPWTSPLNYTLPGITANGGACTITAAFSADATCLLTQAYTSPVSCATCALTAGSNSPVCAGSPLNLTATTVTGASYTWTGPNSFTATTQNPSIASPTTAASGTYTVTATTPSTSCTSTVVVTVNPKPVITAPANISVCAGTAIAAQAFTSVPAGATIAWSNSNTAIGLGASGVTNVPSFTATNATAAPITSTITVTPTLAGCAGTPITYTITINPQPTSTYTQSANQCLTGNSFTFTNTGSTGSYAWTFTGGTPSTSAVVSPTGVTFAAAGTYNISHVVTAAGGCTSTTNSTVTVYPMPTGLTATSTPATCGANNGTITITTGVGGTPGYTYSVNGGAFSGTLGYTGQSAGAHTVVVQDANGCQFTTSVNVATAAGPTALATTTVNSTCGASNGVINIGAVTGGTAGYTYSVNASAFAGTTSYTGFAAGTYTVIVKDANGCTFTTSATVNNTAGPTALAVTTVNSTCGAANGVINIGATTGGTPSYTYSVNAGAFTGTTSYTGFAAGTYTIIVKDANGCTFTRTVVVTNTPGPTAQATTFTNASCGSSNGTITIGATTGGTAAYTYSVNASAFSGTTSYTGFAAGTYSVVVKDANGCTFTTSVTINNASGPTALAVTSTNSTCGAANGTVIIGATTGGLAAYTYSFNGSPFTATTSYTGLAAGTYSVIVKDANGCTFTTSIVVNNNSGPTALATTTIGATCGLSNGTINIGAVTGGAPTYTYSVNASAFTTAVTYGSMAAGTYTVVVKDVNGCTFSTTATISNSGGPTALATSTVNATCGAANGTVNIGAVTGGTAAYTYSINASAFTATTSYTGLTAGTYTVVVKDANGCTFTVNPIVVNTPGPTALAATTTNATCGNSNGIITLGAVTGGTPAYVYSFNASAFTATTSYTGLAAGTYTVVVKDPNGCTFTQTVVVTNTPGPTAQATTFTNASCGSSNGTITIGATTGGTAAYTYSVNASAFSGTTSYTGFAAGTYSVVVKDANGCTFTTSVTINNASGPTALAVTSTNSTCGAANGTVTIGATTGGLAAYTYSFNGSPFTATTSYTGLAAGTYSVIVKDANGCTFTTSIVVNNNSGPTALATTTIGATCGLSNGTINIGAVTGGAPTYTYSVNASAFTTAVTYGSMATGTYTVVVKDVNGCTFSTTATISNSGGPTALATSTVNATCGAANGTVNIGAVTGGTAAYTYSINASAFTATTSYTGLTAGTYTVVVKDANGCTFTVNPVVTNTPGPTALATTFTNATCGNSNGTITLGAVTGGTPAYVYSFNASAFTATISYTGLAAGTYTVVVKDANGCTFTTTRVITNTAGPTAQAVTSTNASCGSSNGTITIGATTGGTAAYTYSVNAGAFSATTSYTGFAAGTYSVVVKDANGCTFTTSATINNASGPTALAVSSTNASCGSSTGTATIGTVTGGIAPYTYSFNASAFTSTTSYTALASGTYNVIVKDANGCTFNTTVTVGSNAAATALATTTTNSTCGAANGVINIGAVTGGAAPYTYSVNASAFTTTVTYGSMAAGTYTVVVKDVNGCTFSTTATIINSPGPTALATATTNSTCGATNGTITIGLVTGGSPAYTYSVNGSPFTATTAYTGFGSGTYTVIVKDANGCTFSTPATVNNTAGPTALATTTVNSTCGNANGTVNIGAVTGGTATYVYSFNAGTFSATTSYTGLAAGTYTVVVKDANGCTFTVNPIVANTPGPTALATTFTNPTCGNSNGTITLGAVTGGTAAYTYSFNGGGFTATTAYTGLTAGTYTVVVQDANGCTFTTTRTITNVPGPTAQATSTTNASCGSSNGSITVGATTGGTPAYTYSVNGSPFTTTTGYTGLAANTYPVIVKDANGCTFTTTATVNNSSGPTALAVSTTNAACGASTGTITIGATTGGLAPYTYSVNASAFTATTSYTGFAAGTYNVTVKDANGCSFNTTAVVNPTTGPTALAVTPGNATCGNSNGTINIGAVTGGAPAYTYSVNAGAFTGTTSYTGFAAGTYNVVVKDANGCTFTTTATITNIPGPTAIALTTGNTTCGTANGSIVLGAVTGGTPAYTYSFNASAFTGTTTYSSLAAGTYSIVVKDANGCTFTTSATLTNTAGPTAQATTFTNPTCGNSNGTITTGATTGGTPTYMYSFNGGGFTATTSYTGLSAGTYTVVVQDANSCTFTTTRTITNVPGPTAQATSTTNASCGASNGTATIGATTGGTAPYTYSFNGGGFSTTTSYTGLAANSYAVVVRDANGCTFTTAAVVANSSGPTALAVTHTDATCGNSNGTATIGATTGGVLPLSYSFNAGAFSTTTSYTGLAAGTYSVIVKDANGCTFATSVVISNITGPTAVAVTTTNTTCGNANGTLTIGAVTGGTLAYTYSLNASAFTATTNYTTLAAGTYTVVVKDANGCTFTTTATITNTPGPTAMATTLTNTTCGNSNGSVVLGAVTGGTSGYTYSFNASAFTGTITYSSLAAGTYSIVVKDANGCTYTTSATLTNTAGPTAQATTFTNPTCGNSNGTITVGATTGGTPTYMYSFNGGGFTATTSYTGLAAGTYTVIVQDANLCTFTTTRTITNVPGPTAQATSTTNASCGASNGTATIGATTGGTAPYLFSFNGGAFSVTTSYTGLAANSYAVVVQDANGCTFTTAAVVNNSSGPTALAVTHTDATCGNSNGTATIGATTGGVLPLSYSFNAGAFSTTTGYTGLAAGTYSVVVKDANGCTFSTPVTISNIAGPTAVAVVTTNTTCGNANGTITLGAVTGGTAAYAYSINASAFTATTNYTALVAGTYTIVVKDANGCTFTTTANITDTPGPTAVVTTITNTTCGNSNGAVAIGTVTAGTPAYTYSFNASAFTSTLSYTGLPAGSNTIIVKDANGCTFTTTANITNTPGPTALITTFSNPTCGNSNGTITLGATTGGTPSYNYSFNGGGFAASTSYTGLAAGTYTVIVQDANLCTFTTTRTITNVPGPTAQVTSTTNASCGASNGTATIGATTGGTAPYLFSFNGSAFTTTISYTGLAANSYPVVVQDANGCTFTTAAVVNNSSGPIALAVTFTDATCGNSNGTATIGATTGGVLPLSYSFNGGAFSTTTGYTGLAAGTYAVVVKDANGCTFSTPVTISNIPGPTAVAVTSTNTTCGNANGTITLGAVTGGTAAYTYSINASAFTATTNYTALIAGTYNIVVKDANGCTFTTTLAITDTPGPTAFATTITNTTCGNSNGAVAIGLVTGGTPAYMYSFNAGAFTSAISYTGLPAGSNTIIVKDANGCTFTQTANITNTPGPTALATTTVNSTCGNANGTVNIGLTTGGTSPYTYSFNGGGFTSTISYPGLAAGTYAVIVKDANGCTFTVNPVVLNTAGPTAQVTTGTNSTCGGANGIITIGATTGGTPAYTYSVGGSPFTATTTYTGLVANTYSVIVKDANGCTFTTSATISDLSGLTASVTAQINVSCNGGTNGTVTVTATGSSAPYSYSLNTAPFVSSGTFTGLTATSYTVTAKDGNGCTFSVPVVITQPSPLTANISAQTNVNCFGGTNGAVTVTASGGTTPFYSYSIDGGAFGTSATFTGLNAGTHPVVVKDGNGCTVTVNVTITQPTALTLATSSVNATCTAPNGSATVIATGAMPLYTYLWAPGGQTTATAVNLYAGNYSVLVTDFNSCTQIANVTVGANPGGVATMSASHNVTCTGANDGSATVSMGAGATPAFTYAWNPSSQTTVTATGLAPATYTVTVTDGNGCTATASTVITQPVILSTSFTNQNATCFGNPNGSSTINVTDGTPPYTYLWTPGGQTTQTATNLGAGTYTCVVTDANNCTKTSTTAITQPTGMALAETHTDANCNQSNGNATVTVAGGTGPYTFSWSTIPVQTTATATGLAANTYVCTVTDGNGCTQNITVIISNLAGPVASIFTINNVSCNGLSDGSATVTISGGTNPYIFLWTNGQTLPSATNLAAGSYTLTATDVNGCVASTSAIITEPAVLATTYSFTNPHCNGAADGTINTNTTGGTMPYTYSWTPGGATTQNVTGLTAASYSVLVSDAHSCTLNTTIVLTNPVAVTATTATTNVTCNGLCNGTATANPLTGTGPYSYSWNDLNAQTTQTASGLCAGTYTVTITDANGCSATAPAVITTPAAITASIVSSGNVTCYNACDGFATANATGGSAPYIFNWMPGSTAGASVNNLCANTYTVTVTDTKGCTATANVTINQPVALTATITNTNVSCYNACDAQATAVYSGGTGPYTFLWTPSLQTTPTATSLCAGVHNLVLTDANGCQANASVAITQPTVLSVATTTINSDCGNANGSACAAITGGNPPFIYAWNDPSTQATSCATNLNAGAYTITVTDGHGCSVTNAANVNDNNAPVVTIPTSSNVTCFGAANGSAQGAITGGIVPYTIAWTPGSQTTAFANSLAGGIYSMVVTDSVGCVGSASITINEPATLVSGIIATSNVSCNLSCDGTSTVQAGGGTSPYTYLWNDGATQTTPSATGLCAQSYTVTTTDVNGCTSTSTTALTQPTPIAITLVTSTNVLCNGGNNGQITISVTGGTAGYSYTWTPNVGSGPVVTNLTAGTYTVLVTDANGCSRTAIFDIHEPGALVLAPNSNSTTCGSSNGSAGVTVSGGVSPYGYLWTPTGATSAIITNVTQGVYNVNVTDANGCIATASSTVLDIAGPVISSINYTEPLCNGTATGTATVIPNGGTPIYSYLWSGTGAQITQTATALTAGTYTVIVSDANHCSTTGTVTFSQPAITQVVVSPTDTICIGQLSQIYGVGYGGTAPYTYTWNPSTFSGSGPITVNPVTTTTYTVYATDAHGCISDLMPMTVFVNPQIQVFATDTSVCAGSFVTISAAATGGNGGPYTYSWSNGYNGASQSVSPLIGTSPMDYIVTATDGGCSISVSDTATVIVNPLAVGFMTVLDTAGCEDFTASFTGLSNIGVGYSWNFGDGSSSVTGINPVHTYTSSGSYNVTLTVTTALGCTSSFTNNSYIDVYPKPHAEFTSSPDPATSTAPLVTFEDHSTGALYWSWNFIYEDQQPGVYTDTLQNPIFSYPDTGQFVVQQIVTNSFGCHDTAYNFVNVIPEYVFYAPNAFTPFNHDGLNDIFMPTGVGIDPTDFQMDIFDRWGNLIFKTNDVNKGWDGRANGGDKIAQIDTYVWKVTTRDYKGNSHSYIGHVTIIK